MNGYDGSLYNNLQYVSIAKFHSMFNAVATFSNPHIPSSANKGVLAFQKICEYSTSLLPKHLAFLST